MVREIKFRIWIPKKNGGEMEEYPEMTEWDVSDNIDFMQQLGKGGIIIQYTGLKDMHDKEIYEGDIFRYWLQDLDENSNNSTEYVEEVMFVNGSFDLDNCALGAFHGMGEVIGNIYENPTLLK